MSSYQNQMLGGIAWDQSSDRNRLLELLKGKLNKDKAAWSKVYDVILPLYRTKVSAGKYKPYMPWTSEGGKVENYLTETSGLPIDIVQTFLLTLQIAASMQQVSMVMWNPLLPGTEQAGIAQRAGDAAAEAARLAAEAAAKTLKELMKGLWPVIIGAVAVAVIIYSPAIKSAGRSVRSAGARIRGSFS